MRSNVRQQIGAAVAAATSDNSSINLRGHLKGRTLALALCALLGVGSGSIATALLGRNTVGAEAAPNSVPSSGDGYVTRREFDERIQRLEDKIESDRREQTQLIIQTIKAQGKQ